MSITPIFSDTDADLRELNWHKLPSNGEHYAVRWYGKVKRPAHRVVLERMLGRPLGKGEVTDHINRNKLDNRRENLRLADKSLNTINREKRPDNTSGYTGVYKYHPKQWQQNGWAMRWSARVERNGKVTYLGYFETPEEAWDARVNYLG